jgi:penicillin-binding protein 2
VGAAFEFMFQKNKKIENSEIFFPEEKPVKNLALNQKDKYEWIEESISLDSSDHFKKKGKDFLGVALGGKKLNLFLLLIFAGLFILLGQAAYLQIFKGNYYREMAEGNRIRLERSGAERGIIYDRNFKLLVKNVPDFSLTVTPADLPKDKDQKNQIINRLAEIIGDDPANIIQTINQDSKSYQPLILKENLDYEKAIQIEIESENMSGIKLEIGVRREYLNEAADGQEVLSLSHILGYEGKITKEEIEANKNKEYFSTDYIGKTGVESYYEDVLRGRDGKKQIEVDALGKEKNVIAVVDPEKGDNVVLTVDFDLQEKLEQILNKHLKTAGKTKGAAVVMDPRNGEILALVSLPSFDNNIFAQGISEKEYQSLIGNPDEPLFTRAISGTYPSGSTIKPMLAAGALEEGIINQNTTFLSTGGIYYDKWFFPDWKAGGHGLTNVTRALAESINTFFYIIGGGYKDFNGLGVEKMKKYVELFGLGNKLGIDLPAEAPGLIPDQEWKEKVKKEEWYIGDTYHFAIGQGDVLVTPLQIASATSVFANGGTLYRPHVVGEITSDVHGPTFIKPQVIRENFIDPKNIEIVRQGLRQAVTSGSAAKLQSLKVTSAGKTGTAQGATDSPSHAWFTGFAPYSNPEIVITVLVEEGGEGSGVAIDVAREFLDWYFNGKS